jgi:hypothetical protein
MIPGSDFSFAQSIQFIVVYLETTQTPSLFNWMKKGSSSAYLVDNDGRVTRRSRVELYQDMRCTKICAALQCVGVPGPVMAVGRSHW